MGPTGCAETLVTINKHCVTSQKSEYSIYTPAEVRNPADCPVLVLLLAFHLLGQYLFRRSR